MKPTHSPLGASAAERWMNCPGSVALAQSITLAESPDPEYRTEGTAAHALIEQCLQGQGRETWELIGDKLEGVEVTDEMASAVQVFLDEVAPFEADCDKRYVEAHLDNPDHEFMYGTIDYGAVRGDTIFIRDFKYGIGIQVPTRDNVQMMYYAYLLLLRHPDVAWVDMRIIQPRIPFRVDEPWRISADELRMWFERICLPAMERTQSSKDLKPGEHCRFCPAKEALACPALKAKFDELSVAAPTVDKYPDDKLLADWEACGPVRMHIKAVQDEVMRRLMAGRMEDNTVCKLVHKKADRVWKPEAPELFKSRFGAKAMTEPELRSPAQMEKIDPAAKELVKEYAYTPQSGYTVVEFDDKRPGIKIQKATEAFKDALDTVDAL